MTALPQSPLPIALMTEEEVARFASGHREEGFGALRCERGLLPLAAMDVDVRVAGVIAAIELAQTFVNTTGGAIEATYIFPLPDRAAVHRFRMEVGGRVIDGVVEERAAAREQYDQAIAAGHRAAIAEQERADVFTLRVGNLMPGERAIVRISLVGPVAIDDGELTLRFPLVVAPRYVPGAELGGEQAGLGTAADTELVPDASRISPPVLLPGFPSPVRLGLRVALEDHDVHAVASSLHAVTSSRRDAHVVEIQPGERLDRDFILRWRLAERELASTLVCADDADGKQGSFMLTFVPPSTTAVAARPRDVVFVLDRSGSMQGWKMVAARRAVARMIDSLTSRDRVHVIAFDNATERAPAVQLADATDRTRFAAVEWLAKIDARGGTELAEPLALAVQMLAGGHDDRERVVVLVTDGQVGNEDQILRELAPHLRNVRVFALGIDQAVNAGFLRRLAGAGGGLCELVESEDRLDAVMAKVHRRIGTPIATELAIRATGLALVHGSIAPRRLPDVYAGAPVVVFGRYTGRAPADAAIELEGRSLGDPLNLAVTRSAEGGAWLAASWARAQLRELEDRFAAGERELEGEIVQVSKQFGVLSRFTAYLAVDRGEVANRDGRIRQVVHPVESPAGWDLAAGARAGGAAPMAMPAMAAPVMAPPSHVRPGPPLPPGAPPPITASAASRPMSQRAAPKAAAPAAPARFMNQLFGRSRKLEADDVGESAPEPAVETSAYLAKLGELARELEREARGACDVPAIRRLRQRLEEWVEDLRSVGADAALAGAVDHLTKRLSAALALGADLRGEALAVAGELARLAGGTTPPPGRRVAFWK